MRAGVVELGVGGAEAKAFSSLLWDGVHDFDYIARATTPGRFVVPPPKAEEMYHPETFGRGSGDVPMQRVAAVLDALRDCTMDDAILGAEVSDGR